MLIRMVPIFATLLCLIVSPLAAFAQGTLTNGGNHGQSIGRDQTHTWTFPANGGDALMVSIAETGDNPHWNPVVTLFGPDGRALRSKDADLANFLAAEAPQSGSYQVMVSGTDRLDRGEEVTYALRLVRAPAAFERGEGSEGAALVKGVNHAGTIDSPGDMDPWTFQATKGETLMVSVYEPGTSEQLEPQVRVFRPDGQELGRPNDKPVARIIEQAPLTGTYTVVVSAGDASHKTGAYVLRRIPPLVPILAVVIFVALFAIATIRNIHFGVLMIPAACAVGVWLAGMSVGDVVDGFPINILILVAAVTYLFAIAQGNGTIDLLIQRVLTAVGSRQGLLPYVIYLITTGVASMGSSQAGYVMIPLAMPAAMRAGVNPMVMAVALNSGMSTGGFAPTSLFGSITLEAARTADIVLSALALLAVAIVANVALLVAATWIFPRPHTTTARRDDDHALPSTSASARFASHHVVTLVCIVCLILTVITCFSMQAARDYFELEWLPRFTPNIGVITFGFAAALALMYPRAGAEAVRRIDWSTAFMVGGIVTFVVVLQRLDADYLLGYAAMNVGTPLVAAFVICMIAGLVSAFASTTGILAALVPIAVPLAGSDGVVGWALLSTMAVCAAIVDASPFSTTGALIVATAAEDQRPRLKSLLTRWGLSMVIVGPVAAVLFLLLLGRP